MTLLTKQLGTMAVCCLALPLMAQDSAPQRPDTGGFVVQVHVDSVLVPVVVRDAQGRAIGDLKQDDFKIFDQGKRRQLNGFTLEKNAPVPDAPAASDQSASPGAGATAPQASAAVAGRNVILLIDDRHLGAGELEEVKKAAGKMLEGPLPDGERVVLLSFLGVNSGITHDHAALQAALLKLKARQGFKRDHAQCPDIDYYSADQILNKHNDIEFQAQIEKADKCAHHNGSDNAIYYEQLIRSGATVSLQEGDQDVRETLAYLRDVVHTMSRLPGERTLVLVSPGFLTTASDEAMSHESQILDLAAQSHVTISTLDAGGLIGPIMSASESGAGSLVSTMTGQGQQNGTDSRRQGRQALAEFADGTGGSFFHNSNDMAGGLKNLVAGPEYRYLLELSLDGVKQNGALHSLKVEVDRKDVKVQARQSYVAPANPKGKK